MRVAIVGGGQLARMLALAGLRLGMQFSFLLDSKDRRETDCIDGLGKQVLLEADPDWQAVFDALGEPDLITVEKEQIDPEVLQALSRFCPVYPSPPAFEDCSYRQRQKQILQQLQIPTSPWCYLNEGGDLPQDIDRLRYPLFAKSTHNAYDGRNQFILKDRQALRSFWQQQVESSWIVEESVDFTRELSIIAVRSAEGEMCFYPAVENHHRNGVLIYSISPAPEISSQQQGVLEDYARRIMATMGYIGVLAIECFQAGDKMIVNEIAPRVHNSGHWTSNGSITCQFENHLRAVAGLPLGATDSIGHTAMVNLLGVDAPPLGLLSSRSALHWYNKTSRPGRKVGHINLHNASLPALQGDIHALINQMECMQDVSERQTA